MRLEWGSDETEIIKGACLQRMQMSAFFVPKNVISIKIIKPHQLIGLNNLLHSAVFTFANEHRFLYVTRKSTVITIITASAVYVGMIGQVVNNV